MSAHLDPLVTIVTPTYNRAAYIPETIASIRAQTYSRVQHLVIDDGSSDDTAQVLSTIGGPTQVLRQENAGEPTAVNAGFAAAEGDILGVVNDDDPVRPELVERMVAAFAADPDLLVVYPDWEMIDADGTVLTSVHPPDYSFVDMVRWHYCLPGPGTFFRRRVLECEGGRDPAFRLAGDFEFWLRVARHGRFRRLPEVLATWRRHAGGTTTAAKGRAMAQQHRAILDKFYSLDRIPPEVRAVRDEAYASGDYIGAIECLEPDPGYAFHLLARSVRRYPRILWDLPPHFAYSRRRFAKAAARNLAQRVGLARSGGTGA